MIKFKEIDSLESDIWRVFISGSSSAGKTYFAKQLLNSGFMKYERIHYFHPDIQENFPVDWNDLPVICQAGLPTSDDILSLPAYSVVILDDLFTEACKEKFINYLFRVLIPTSNINFHTSVMNFHTFLEFYTFGMYFHTFKEHLLVTLIIQNRSRGHTS